MHAEAASLSHDDFETNLKALCSSGIQSIKRHSFGDFDDAGIKIFSGANAVKNLLKFEYKVLVSVPAADAPLCIVWDDHYTLYTLELLSHTTNVYVACACPGAQEFDGGDEDHCKELVQPRDRLFWWGCTI